MRVLMFGWEFPPYKSGGLGTACHGMASALVRKGTEVIFVVPAVNEINDPNSPAAKANIPLRSASGICISSQWRSEYLTSEMSSFWHEKLHIRHIESLLFPYATEESYNEYLNSLHAGKTFKFKNNELSGRDDSVIRLHAGYGEDILSEVYRYALAASVIAQQEQFDVIHVHDWMTYPAGLLARKVTGKPLVAHIHAMEYDRSGANQNPTIAAIEREGLNNADMVVAVSHYTKRLVMEQYGVAEHKIMVVHNAVNHDTAQIVYKAPSYLANEKRVLFMGRITFQKGPDYFVEAARLVLQKMPNVRFIMAGTGDMLPNMVRRVAQLRMGNRFHFTGFLRGEDVDRMYALSDLYVMPSVSEPFGIAPLEAMSYDVPVLISRQSGVAEVVRNAIKVDFWNVNEMANKICAILAYPVLAREVVKNCREELKTIRWENAANRLNDIYARVMS